MVNGTSTVIHRPLMIHHPAGAYAYHCNESMFFVGGIAIGLLIGLVIAWIMVRDVRRRSVVIKPL